MLLLGISIKYPPKHMYASCNTSWDPAHPPQMHQDGNVTRDLQRVVSALLATLISVRGLSSGQLLYCVCRVMQRCSSVIGQRASFYSTAV